MPFPSRPERIDNLPLQLTHFVGREPELAQIRQLLSSERLLTLSGTGGIGKTRLALEVAAQVRDAYPNGVCLVEFGSLAEPALVAQAVAGPLGVRAEGEASLVHALANFLRSRQFLLVLDNCEHLVQACAALAEDLLRGCPDLCIMATSREALRVPGERTWRVPALSLPGPKARLSPEHLLEYEAVRLFVDRASTTPGFALTEDSAPAVAHLCQQLEGIPLAIELAAGRTGVLSAQQIATRLDDRFRLLVGGGRNAPARQQTLRAMIDWSYDLLTPAERVLLCRLSVFAGGWTLEAAEAVCPVPSVRVDAEEGVAAADILDLLGRLVDKSLVQVEPGGGGQPRYRLLESVRQYAQDRLHDTGHQAAVQARHWVYFCMVAEEAEAHVLWGAGGVGWLARLESEQGNLRAAMGRSLATPGDPARGLRIVGLLGHFWYTRGDRAEGRAWLRQALECTADSTSTDTSTRAWALLWAGGLAHGQSEYDEAIGLLKRALEAFEQLGDTRGSGWALSFLGYVARARAELDQAAAFLERAVALLRSIDDELSVIAPLAALGFTVGALGDQARATMLLEESVALARHTGSTGRLAIASLYLGQVAYAQGDSARASAAWEEGLKLSREWGSAWAMAECLEGLAAIAGGEGQPGRSARLFGAAAMLRGAIGAPVHPVDRIANDRVAADVHAALGSKAFEHAWAAGQQMGLNEVVDYAIAREQLAAAGAGPGAPGRTARLTPREREVAVLIARGLSNRQIAETLVIAERTATNHIEHILGKLGFHSRSQVAAWATEQRLLGIE